jgi:phage tail-like protein
VVNGKIERRQVTVALTDAAGKDVWRWVFDKAYPVKWSGSGLNASNNTVLVEAVDLAHNGMRRE